MILDRPPWPNNRLVSSRSLIFRIISVTDRVVEIAALHVVLRLLRREGDWQHWSEKVPEYIYPSDSVPEFATILVPNVDNTRTNFLMETIAKQQKVTATNRPPRVAAACSQLPVCVTV